MPGDRVRTKRGEISKRKRSGSEASLIFASPTVCYRRLEPHIHFLTSSADIDGARRDAPAARPSPLDTPAQYAQPAGLRNLGLEALRSSRSGLQESAEEWKMEFGRPRRALGSVARQAAE
jgi:hypothetical protein